MPVEFCLMIFAHLALHVRERCRRALPPQGGSLSRDWALETVRGGQVAAGFAGFLGLRDVVLAGFFRAVTGLMAIGRPTGAAATGSGSGLK